MYFSIGWEFHIRVDLKCKKKFTSITTGSTKVSSVYSAIKSLETCFQYSNKLQLFGISNQVFNLFLNSSASQSFLNSLTLKGVITSLIFAIEGIHFLEITESSSNPWQSYDMSGSKKIASKCDSYYNIDNQLNILVPL